LREKAAAFKLLAEGLPYGREREDLLVRARRLETASHIGKWISSPVVATHVKSHRAPDVGPRLQTMAERLHNGRVTWLGGSGHHFRRFDQIRPDQVNLGAGTSPDLRTSDQWGLGLIHIWRVNDIKRPRLRIIIYSLFRAGIALLAVPAAFTFLQVTLLLAKHLLARI